MTVCAADVAAHPSALATVTVYPVVSAGLTSMVCVVAPVDQRCDVCPIPASNVTLDPSQTEVGPVILTVGNALTATV